MAARNFQIVDEDTPSPSTTDTGSSAALALLMLSLKTLSQRALVALADLFCLFTSLTVFWLFLLMPEDPTPQRLVALGLYAAFIIVVNAIVRRGK